MDHNIPLSERHPLYHSKKNGSRHIYHDHRKYRFTRFTNTILLYAVPHLDLSTLLIKNIVVALIGIAISALNMTLLIAQVTVRSRASPIT